MVNAEQFSNGLRTLRSQLAAIDGTVYGGEYGSSAEQQALQQVQAVADKLEVTAQLIEERQRRLLQSRAELAARFQAYGEALDAFDCACIVTDGAGAVLDANRAALALLGYHDLALLRGKPLVVFIPLPERRAFRRRLLQPGPAPNVVEWTANLSPRGRSPFQARLSMAPILGDKGAVQELCWVLRNLEEPAAPCRQDEAKAPASPRHGQALCAEIARQRAQVKAATNAQVAWQEDTEGILANELYNRLGQDLTTLLLSRAGLDGSLAAGDGQSSSAAPGPAAASSARREQIAEACRLVRTLMADLQELARVLRPLSLDLFGLMPALQEMMDGHGRTPAMPVSVEATGFDGHRLRPELERLIFRFVQEVLSLFERGTPQSAALSVTVSWSGAWVRVAVESAPGAAVPAQLDGHPGWRAVKGRVEVLGGTAGVESADDGQTLIWAAVPALEAA